MDNDKIIFDNKKFSDLLKEIYDNQKKKNNQISTLITELKPLITEIGDATLIVPLIAEYLEMGIKNDDLLVKLAALAQRNNQSSPTNENPLGISEKEKEELLNNLNKQSKQND